jgi:hypothetical protein
MNDFRVFPIPAPLIDAARATGRSPQYGHPVHREIAAGTGPCRSCLSTFTIGRDERILFTYDPFEDLDPYPLPGPVFVHAEPCTPHSGDGFPPGLRVLPLVFEGFGERREPRGREFASGTEIDAAIHRLLRDPAVSYLHVRNAEAGCYIARIERTAANFPPRAG